MVLWMEVPGGGGRSGSDRRSGGDPGTSEAHQIKVNPRSHPPFLDQTLHRLEDDLSQGSTLWWTLGGGRQSHEAPSEENHQTPALTVGRAIHGSHCCRGNAELSAVGAHPPRRSRGSHLPRPQRNSSRCPSR